MGGNCIAPKGHDLHVVGAISNNDQLVFILVKAHQGRRGTSAFTDLKAHFFLTLRAIEKAPWQKYRPRLKAQAHDKGLPRAPRIYGQALRIVDLC